MRLISLNIWHGRRYQQIMDFISHNRRSTDIFCFQEVHNQRAGSVHAVQENANGIVPDIYNRIQAGLRGFSGHLSGEYSSLHERLAIMSAESIEVSGEGELLLCRQKKVVVDGNAFSEGSRLQWVSFECEDGQFTIANVHGFWVPGSKDDSQESILQSEKIIEFLRARDGATILCGDLNLSPQTRSIAMLDERMRNLINEYGVSTTRSSFTPPEKGRYADYIFVSRKVNVKNFKVMKDEVSDHLPLLLEFY